MFHLRLANSWIQKIKRFFLQGKTDESTFSLHDWPVVQTNKDSVSTWKNTMLDISNSDGTVRKYIRWNNVLNSHSKTNASVNTNHTIICIKASETKIRHYAADKSR